MAQPVIVAIIGTRNYSATTVGDKVVYTRLHWIDAEVRFLKEHYGSDLKIISGGSGVVDKAAKAASEQHEVAFEEFLADWSLGLHAGPQRTKAVVDMADLVVAFWDGVSRGTRHGIAHCIATKTHFRVIFDVPTVKMRDAAVTD